MNDIEITYTICKWSDTICQISFSPDYDEYCMYDILCKINETVLQDCRWHHLNDSYAKTNNCLLVEHSHLDNVQFVLNSLGFQMREDVDARG